MADTSSVQSIVVYIIERHPLDPPETGPLFRWLHVEGDIEGELENLIGTYNPSDLSILVDKYPAGPQWELLIKSLLDNRVSKVVTHLAPLSSAQRQQLIGVCAQMGTQLITPSDAGRNRPGEDGPTTRV